MFYTRTPRTYLPVEHDIAAPWRAARRDMDEAAFFIGQHLRCLSEATERPAYLAYVEKRLAEHLASYRASLRIATEAEIAMTAAGIHFTRA